MDALTPGEQRLIMAALQLSAGEYMSNLKVNYTDLAAAANLKTAASAQVMFCKAKRKFVEALKAKEDGSQKGDASTQDAAHKKVAADKVTKRPRNGAAKGKAAAKASKLATDEEPITQAGDVPDDNAVQGNAKGKKRAVPKKKAKMEPDTDMLEPMIKTEVKPDPEFEDFAKGILEGAQYPQTKEAWIQADAVFYEAHAYLSMSEGSSSGSGFSTPMTE